MKNRHFLFFVLLLLCGVPVLAQKPASASVAADKTTILIGEPLQLTVEATFSKAHMPVFFRIDSLPHFEILSQSKIDTQATASQTVLKQIFTLTSWDSGMWLVPAFSLPDVKGVTTKPLPVNVTYSPMPATQDYHDVKDILEVAKPPRTTWYWYVIGAVLLLLLVLLLFPKKKKETVADAIVQKEGAYKEALKELDALKSKTSLDDDFYFTILIAIFRRYLQHGHNIHSFQQTTGELSRQLELLHLPHEDFKKLVATLQLSDFVKFAQYKAAEAERDNAWSEIKQSIIAIEQQKK